MMFPGSTTSGGNMATAGAMVRIYRVTDAEAQLLIGALLGGMAGLTVHLRGGDPHHYLVIESSTYIQVRSVHRFVTSIDPGSTMIHATHGVADAVVA